MDYLQIGFHAQGPLTLLVWPKIHAAMGAFEYGQAGYADALSSLIGDVAVTVTIDERQSISIQLASGTRLEAALADIGGSEKAILQGPDHYFYAI